MAIGFKMLIKKLDNALFVVNPVSGKLSIKKKLSLINHIIQNNNSEIVVTRSPEESVEKSKEAMLNGRLVISCGGDGLQNMVAEQAIKTGGTMAVFPMGRGNDFAASIKVNDANDLKLTLASGTVYKARYLAVEFGEYKKICLTCAGVGLLSEAAFRASRIPILKGSLLYAVATLLSFINLHNHGYQLLTSGKDKDDSFLIIAGAASSYTGGGMFIAPDAFKEEGKVNLLSAKKVSRMQAVKLLSQVFSGKHINNSNVINSHVSEFEINTQSSNSWAKLVYGDGEYLGTLPVKISIGKDPLNVLVPSLDS
jgi:diacylglycerol kinase (ATP)